MTAARRVDQPTLPGPSDLLAALGGIDCAGAAQVYAACGYPVIPMHAACLDGSCTCPAGPACPDPGKHPRLAGWPQLAATDSDRVRGWWRRWPDANPGLATGRRFDVLDLDGPEGVEALRAILQRDPLDHPGPVARSGSGGWHLLYATTGLGTASGCWRGWTGAAGAGWPWRHPPGTPAAAGTPGCGP